jgi:hypothetical protein
MPLVTCMQELSSEQAWEPIASSSAKSCPKPTTSSSPQVWPRKPGAQWQAPSMQLPSSSQSREVVQPGQVGGGGAGGGGGGGGGGPGGGGGGLRWRAMPRQRESV